MYNITEQRQAPDNRDNYQTFYKGFILLTNRTEPGI